MHEYRNIEYDSYGYVQQLSFKDDVYAKMIHKCWHCHEIIANGVIVFGKPFCTNEHAMFYELNK